MVGDWQISVEPEAAGGKYSKGNSTISIESSKMPCFRWSTLTQVKYQQTASEDIVTHSEEKVGDRI
jgi:hypothetical protein